jgi:hypothetical protein
VVPYCDASAGGISGHQAIVAAHVVYFGAAFYWWRRASGEVLERGGWILPLAAAIYALDSALWHLTGRWIFAAGDGALTLVFLTAVAEWPLPERAGLSPGRRLMRGLVPALLYVPLYAAFANTAYLLAMVGGGAFVLRTVWRLNDPRMWRWSGAALGAILLAFGGWLLDAPLCGRTGFLTGHALDHFLDGWCFFFLLGAMLPHPLPDRRF